MDDKTLYFIMELNYYEALGRKISDDLAANFDLFPSDWFSNDDYDFKIRVLGEAIEKKVKIVDTELYAKSLEGKIL